MPRPSPVTDAVRALVEREEHHAWLLDDLLVAVRREVPGADYSSVFRAVSTLERQDLVVRVDIGDGRARYESRRAHHEHIVCSSCGAVAEIAGCALPEVTRRVADTTGYRVSSHRLTFSGLCPACQGALPVRAAR